jgi:hypothetical protein
MFTIFTLLHTLCCVLTWAGSMTKGSLNTATNEQLWPYWRMATVMYPPLYWCSDTTFSEVIYVLHEIDLLVPLEGAIATFLLVMCQAHSYQVMVDTKDVIFYPLYKWINQTVNWAVLLFCGLCKSNYLYSWKLFCEAVHTGKSTHSFFSLSDLLFLHFKNSEEQFTKPLIQWSMVNSTLHYNLWGAFSI